MEYCCIFDESEKEFVNKKDFCVVKVYDDVGAPGDCKRKLMKCNKCGALFIYQGLTWNDDYYDDYIQVENEEEANKLYSELNALRFRVKENPMIMIGSDNIVRYRLPNEESKK